MDEKRVISEKLLDAWLSLSSTVWNRRVVSAMTFNEIFVCNLLRHQMEENPGARLTATDLCDKMRLFKSQMNKVLNSMEEKGYIKRKEIRWNKNSFVPVSYRIFRRCEVYRCSI